MTIQVTCVITKLTEEEKDGEGDAEKEFIFCRKMIPAERDDEFDAVGRRLIGGVSD